MVDPTRQFESETSSLSGLETAGAKAGNGEFPATLPHKSPRKESPDAARTRPLILRLIKYFEQEPPGLGEP